MATPPEGPSATMRTGVPMFALLLAGAVQASPQDDWWARMQALCGRAFAGELRQAPPGDGSFAGRSLVMHVRDCEPDRIRIPFVVGDDRSRTWVLTRREGRIVLKHDHRHQDGRPGAVTMYGGTTPNPGSAEAQLFPADDDTVAVLPDGYPNVWMMAVEPGVAFTYFVQRLNTPRAFHVRFDLAREVAAPQPPWGWND